MASNAKDEILKRDSEDIGWEYGKPYDPTNIDKTQCNLCGKKMTSGVYRLKHHIAGTGENVSACKHATTEDQLRVREALNDVKRKKKAKIQDELELRAEVNIKDTVDVELDDCFDEMKGPKSFGPIDRFAKSVDLTGKTKQSNLSKIVLKEQLSRVKEYICDWAYQCAIAFHAFEKDSFKKVMEAIGQFGPMAEPPTRYEMSETYLKKRVEKTKKEIEKYREEWKYTGCSLMTDAWSDRQRRSIMNLCVNSKMGTVFLTSNECSSEAHTKEKIFEYVDKCIDAIGSEYVVQVVTDNASNNMGAAVLLKEKRPRIIWTSCAAHTINLMLEAIGGLKRYKKALDQARKLTVFIYAHHRTLAMMRKYTKKTNIVRPGVTRFASAYLTLVSLKKKKVQLRKMFLSQERESCNFSKTAKGKQAYAMVVSPGFWTGVTTCLEVFEPLVKVLRMVDADWKPSMGFVYGELKKAREEIKGALNGNKSDYEPILKIISKKSSKRLDTCLHMAAYFLNPYYYYNNKEVREDSNANDAVTDLVGILHHLEFDMQNQILMVELPMYKSKQGRFDRPGAIKACEVNNDRFEPAIWWDTYGSSTPNLKRIAMRILSLTTSSSGCERAWSMFEGVHTKKRNRLVPTRLNDLVFVQFNSNLMERNRTRKLRDRETLVDESGAGAKEWIFDGEDEEAKKVVHQVDEEAEADVDGGDEESDSDVDLDVEDVEAEPVVDGEDEVEPGLPWETLSEAAGTEELLTTRKSARTKAGTSVKSSARQLVDEESDEEEEVEHESDYESDGVQIVEVNGDDDEA